MDLNNIIDKLSYKPGWEFWLDAGWLNIRAEVLHSETLLPVTFDIKRIIPRVAQTSEADFLSWWEDILMEAEYHELREFARYQGKLIDDPHESTPA